MVTLRLFGGASLESGRIPISGRSAQRRRLALLALLATSRRGLTRDRLIGYLWAEHDPEKARRLLSESLYVIRRELGEDVIVVAGDMLRLNDATVQCDVLAFEDALNRGEAAAAAALYTGVFLDGFYISAGAEFERWVDGERDRLARAYRETLERLARDATADGKSEEAVSWWRKLAEQDPYSGRHTVGLMKALDATGRRSAALQLARVHAALLRDELEAEPDPEVAQLAARLRDAPDATPITSVSSANEPAQAETREEPDTQEAGTITFLFSDIEGSTALLRRLGSRYAALLSTHHTIVRACVREHHGREIDNAGDGFFIAFRTARDAVAAAVAIQRRIAQATWPGGVTVRVRMGVHTGEPSITHQGYIGIDVHRAARIGGAAQGGQVLLSSTTRELLGSDLPAGIRFRDFGHHKLKDLEAAEHLYALEFNAVPDADATVSSPAATDPSVSERTELREGPAAPQPVAAARRAARPRGVLYGVASSLFVLATIGIMVRSQVEEAPAVVSPARASRTIAVLPFGVAGSGASEDWGAAMVTLLTLNLEGTPDLRVIDADAILAESSMDAPATPVAAAAVAGRLGADLFTRGEIIHLGGRRYSVVARLYEEGGQTPIITVNGEGSDLGVLADDIANHLLAELIGGSARQNLARIALVTSDVPDAVLAWLRGEQHFARARYELAVEAFQEAVELDREFALAHYRLSMAAEWDLQFGLVQFHADRALEHSADLPAHHQNLIRAWSHLIDGRAEEAAALYHDVRDARPEELEAAYGLGEAIVHFSPLRGQPIEPARAYFQEVLERTPNYGDARFHLLEFAAAERDVVAFDTLLAAVDSASEQWPAWQAVRAFGWGTDARQSALLQRLERNARSEVVGMAAARVAANLHEFAGARRIAQILVDRADESRWRAAGLVLQAHLDFAGGEYRRALATLEYATALEPQWSHELRALFALPDYVGPTPEELSAARQAVEALDLAERSPGTTFILGVHAYAHAVLKPYLQGMLSVRMGEVEAAEGHLAALRRISTELAAPLQRTAVDGLDAAILLAAGDTARAVERLLRVRPQATIEQAGISAFHARALDRLAIADLLRAQGRYADALPWYRSLTEGYEILFVAPGHLAMSDVFGALGEPDSAAVHRAQFDRLWSSADPGLNARLTGLQMRPAGQTN